MKQKTLILVLILTAEILFAKEISPVNVYTYDPNASLELKQMENSDYNDSSATVYTIMYQGPLRKVMALMVIPNKKGSFAGIIFQHWTFATKDNTEFINEALELAGQGVVSILPNGYLPSLEALKGNESDTNLVINQIIEIRRAVDVLLAQPGVDPQRIGFIGHDYGAVHGAVLSGVENRIKAYVLMAPTAHYWDWGSFSYKNALQSSSSENEDTEYRKLMLPFDPVSYVGHAAPASLLFQFSKTSGWATPAKEQELYDAASQPKEIRWYDSGHSLDSEAKTFRDRWILEKLGGMKKR